MPSSTRRVATSLLEFGRGLWGFAGVVIGSTAFALAGYVFAFSEWSPRVLVGVGYAGLTVGAFMVFHRLRLDSIAREVAAAEDGLAMQEDADKRMESAARLLDSAEQTQRRNRVLEERIRANREELRAVLVENNRNVLRRIGYEAQTAEQAREAVFRIARTELDLLILDGEAIRTRGLMGLIDDGLADRQWIERALRYADRAFMSELLGPFRQRAVPLIEGTWPQRTKQVVEALLVARERFTVDNLDPHFRPG